MTKKKYRNQTAGGAILGTIDILKVLWYNWDKINIGMRGSLMEATFREIKGISVSDGVVFGTIYKTVDIQQKPNTLPTYIIEEERDRFNNACHTVISNLVTLYDHAKRQVGNETAKIFTFHQEIIKDPVFLQCVETYINQHYCCEYAVARASEAYQSVIMDTGDENLISRCCDVEDVCGHLLSELLPNNEQILKSITKPCILLVRELTPSLAISLDPQKTLGVVEQKGSPHSHSAILMRSVGIPCVCMISEQYDMLETSQEAILDGLSGTITIGYDEKTARKYHKLLHKQQAEQENWSTIEQVKLINQFGKEIKVHANVFSLLEIDSLLDNSNAYISGVGLFRSEFIYMGLSALPSQSYQYSVYEKLLKKLKNRMVVIRTLDIGGDKILPYVIDELTPEMRGVEFSLARVDIFKTQLKALFQASTSGKLAILIPMITKVKQLVQVKQIIDEVKHELRAEKISYSQNVKLGVMIETPQAVEISETLATQCDFFCIGTNDLTALTAALDSDHDPAQTRFNSVQNHASARVLALVHKAVKNAENQGIPCSICGDSAYDLNLLHRYLAMGVTGFSVPIKQIPLVKAELSSLLNK